MVQKQLIIGGDLLKFVLRFMLLANDNWVLLIINMDDIDHAESDNL